MNQRIKNLADQARRNEPFECSYTKDQWLEKFAELIVRECIDTVLDCSIEYATRPQIAQELKEHFGVE